MRTSLLLALVLAPALAFGAAPARRPVIALLPPRTEAPDLFNLGLLMEARAAELLEASGKYSELHLKQLLAMADQEGYAPEALSDDALSDKVRDIMGADRVFALRIKKEGKTLVLSGTIRDGKKPATFSATVPAAWAEALPQASEAMARAMLDFDKAPMPAVKGAQPESKNEAALVALGDCYPMAMRQSVGLESPVTLNGEELDGATAACTKALEADGSLRFARATLVLLQAIGGDDKGAVKTMKGLSDATDGAVGPYLLARFWLITRFQSNDAGLAFLSDVIRKHPGQLLPRAYLGDALALLGQHPKALSVWNDYLALAPTSAFALGRLSREQARTGKTEDAIKTAKKALELAPESREARLQLASRDIDAKKLEDAIATLKPITALKSVPPEHLLRIGWAYWLSGDADAAAMCFQEASVNASGPTGWRTRGRAFYNLALVAMKQGRTEDAKKAYVSSLSTGFKVKTPDASLLEVAKAASVPEPKREPSKLRESSLFPDEDEDGVPDVKAKKPSAPEDWLPYKPSK